MRRSKRSESGGAKSAIPEAVRTEALRLARRDGAAKAAKALGLKGGTVRSWMRRAELAELRAQSRGDDGGALERLKAEGQRVLEARDAECARQAADQPEPASVIAEPEPRREHQGAESGRRRAAENLLDESFPEPDAVTREERQRVLRRSDEQIVLPDPEPPPLAPAPEVSDEARWRSLAERMGRSGAGEGPSPDRYDPTGYERHDEGRGR